jgi:hypothetical protein
MNCNYILTLRFGFVIFMLCFDDDYSLTVTFGDSAIYVMML